MKKVTIKLILIVLGFGVMVTHNLAQTKKPERRENFHVLKAEVINGDTIPHIDLPEVNVIPKWNFKNNKEQVTYTRLARNVKIALPYARIAGEKLYEINSQLEKIKSEKDRKNYLKQAEKDLFAEFEGPLRKLTFSQGKILIKLLDRETGNTGFELIKEYRGGVSAFFWQGIARIFGANLKDVYNTENNEDAMIEHIIKMIDNGLM